MRSIIVLLLAWMACASTPRVPFRAPWTGADQYHQILMCAATQEYGEEIAREFGDVEVELAPGLNWQGTTVGRIIRIRAELSQVEREAAWRHEATHWLEHRRTGRWVYYPACWEKSPKADPEFVHREKVFNASAALCRKDLLNER